MVRRYGCQLAPGDQQRSRARQAASFLPGRGALAVSLRKIDSSRSPTAVQAVAGPRSPATSARASCGRSVGGAFGPEHGQLAALGDHGDAGDARHAAHRLPPPAPPRRAPPAPPRRPRRPACASSSSVPWATISPSWMTSSRSQVWLISERMWLERSTVCSPLRSRMSVAHLDDLHRVEAARSARRGSAAPACAPSPAPRRRAGGSRARARRSARRSTSRRAVCSSASSTRAARPRRRDAAELRHEGEVRADRHLVVERRRVGQKADALADLVRVARSRRARRSATRPDVGRSTQPRIFRVVRLARAVEPEEADDLAPS